MKTISFEAIKSKAIAAFERHVHNNSFNTEALLQLPAVLAVRQYGITPEVARNLIKEVWTDEGKSLIDRWDDFTGRELFSLWDDEVAEAIEQGLISQPGVPRAKDSDWLPYLIAYANDQGLLQIPAIEVAEVAEAPSP